MSRNETDIFVEPRGRDERGAVLILALLFVVAVGLVATALATWATNDINNSKTFTTVEALHSDASGMMKMSIQYVRYNPIISFNQAAGVASPVVACWGGTQPQDLPLIDNLQVAVWCTTVWNPGSAVTRTVTFYACAEAVPASICTMANRALLTEVVVFDDYPQGVNAPVQGLCTLTCGMGMTVANSTWGPSVVNAAGVTPIAISFAREPSPTSVGVATTAYVQVLGAGSLPISNQTVTLSAASGGTLSSASTLSAVTNTSGIAVFNNIVPSSAGSIILLATDGTLSATSTAFQVLKGANTVTPSGTPSNAQVGTPVTVSATATSGDQIVTSGTPGIVVSSTTTSVCSASGATVTLTGVGSCNLVFTDSGNSNYVSASASMSFSVTGPAPSKIVVSAASASVIASSTSSDAVTLKLEAANGTLTESSTPTTVTLASTGRGYFTAPSTGPSTSSTTSATIAANTSSVTVYFGDTVAQSVNVTATSGSLSPGTTTITVTPGPVSSVRVSAASSSVIASSTSNDAVTLSLMDQYNNVVSPTVDTTVTLASTGRGYFTAPSTGPSTSSTTSATIAANTSSATVYFGDTKAESPTVSATVGSASGSTFVTVTAASPSKVVVSTPNPSSTTTSSQSNLTVNVSLADQFGNPVTPTSATSLSLASSGGGFFTTNLGGDSTTTCVTISANNASASAYFGDQTAQTVNISVGGSVTSSCGTAGLTPGTATILVVANGPTAIAVTPSSSQFSASGNSNKWSDPTTLQLVDQQGNPVTAQSDVVLTLTLSSSTARVATKSNGSYSPVSSVTIPQGSSSVTVYLQDSRAEQFALSASGTTWLGNVVSGNVTLRATNGGNGN